MAKPNFDHCTVFDEDLVTVHMKKTELVFNKPVYLGMSILDISKTLMYDFHYNYIKKKYGPKAKLLLTYTDSLMHEMHTEDFFEDIREGIKEKFDTSNFENSKLPRLNKKVPGKFKDEAGGKIISEFVGLIECFFEAMGLHRTLDLNSNPIESTHSRIISNEQ